MRTKFWKTLSKVFIKISKEWGLYGKFWKGPFWAPIVQKAPRATSTRTARRDAESCYTRTLLFRSCWRARNAFRHCFGYFRITPGHREWRTNRRSFVLWRGEATFSKNFKNFNFQCDFKREFRKFSCRRRTFERLWTLASPHSVSDDLAKSINKIA